MKLGLPSAPIDPRRSYRANKIRKPRPRPVEPNPELVSKLARYSDDFHETVYRSIREKNTPKDAGRVIAAIKKAIVQYRIQHGISAETVNLTSRY